MRYARAGIEHTKLIVAALSIAVAGGVAGSLATLVWFGSVGAFFKSEAFWTAVAALATLVGLGFAGRQLFLGRTIEAYRFLSEDDEFFESDTMRAARSNLARVLLQDSSNHELVGKASSRVIDVFEDLGLLLRKRVAPLDLMWNSKVGDYVLWYWPVLKSFVEEDRRLERNENYYTDFQGLYEAVVAHEQKKLHGDFSPPTKEELDEFIKDELNVEIRVVDKNDLEAVEEIESRTFTTDAYDYKAFEEAYEEQRTWFLVATILNKIVGYVLGSVTIDGSEGEIISLAVELECHRCGIEERLLSHLVARLKREGVKSVCLQVAVSNGVAREMYEEAGFHVVETVTDYYVDGSDAHLMKIGLDTSGT